MDEPAQQGITLNLTGRELKGGWRVTRKLPRPGEPGAEHATGGKFSLCYLCEKDGKTAFLKVFDIANALQEDDVLSELRDIVNCWDHETALLQVCDDAKLSRIVRSFGRDTLHFQTPETGPIKLPICYIIFEKADGGDIRNTITRLGAVEDATRLTMLHQVAVAISQLHNVNIAHQDMKPSNVLIFDKSKEGAKLADLGRASMKGREGPHGDLAWACQGAYAPLEQLYDYRPADWHERREACDLYQFGSLVCFLFSGKSATTGTLKYVPKEYGPNVWRGKYVDVLPFLQKGFACFLTEVADHLPPWGREKLLTVIRQACDPDVHVRGDPTARKQVNSPLGVDRFVSRMDALRLQAVLEARKEANAAA